MTDNDLTEREQVILSTHNWVGSAHPSLSANARRIVFACVLGERLGVYTETEVAAVLNEMAGYRKAIRERFG